MEREGERGEESLDGQKPPPELEGIIGGGWVGGQHDKTKTRRKS